MRRRQQAAAGWELIPAPRLALALDQTSLCSADGLKGVVGFRRRGEWGRTLRGQYLAGAPPTLSNRPIDPVLVWSPLRTASEPTASALQTSGPLPPALPRLHRALRSRVLRDSSASSPVPTHATMGRGGDGRAMHRWVQRRAFLPHCAAAAAARQRGPPPAPLTLPPVDIQPRPSEPSPRVLCWCHLAHDVLPPCVMGGSNPRCEPAHPPSLPSSCTNAAGPPPPPPPPSPTTAPSTHPVT